MERLRISAALCPAGSKGDATMAGKFELKKAGNGQFLFHLKASNGQVILASEQYKERRGALRGIESVKKNAPLDNRYERKAAKNGQPYFVLRASNGKTIGQSEMYNSAASVDKGIESVKKNAADATVDDKTA
jgi:uncharacterized protein YegP (UPF0339 family)